MAVITALRFFMLRAKKRILRNSILIKYLLKSPKPDYNDAMDCFNERSRPLSLLIVMSLKLILVYSKN